MLHRLEPTSSLFSILVSSFSIEEIIILYSAVITLCSFAKRLKISSKLGCSFSRISLSLDNLALGSLLFLEAEPKAKGVGNLRQKISKYVFVSTFLQIKKAIFLTT